MRECLEHTDLEWRLAQIPDSAACRGVFLNMLDERASEFGPDILNEYRDFFSIYHFSGFRLYPVKDYLRRIVKLAELRFGGPDIYKGIFEIQAAAFPSWRRTLVGRTAFAVLGVQFDSILRVTGISVSKAVNYAECRIVRDGPMHFTAYFNNEYMYIEHAMAGALTGVARACEVPVSLDVRLRDPFNGEIGISVLDESVAHVP